MHRGQNYALLSYAVKESDVVITTDNCDMPLVTAAKDGDHQAYAELCRRHSKQVLRTVLRITGNTADAEDMLQEALPSAVENRSGTFPSEGDSKRMMTQVQASTQLAGATRLWRFLSLQQAAEHRNKQGYPFGIR